MEEEWTTSQALSLLAAVTESNKKGKRGVKSSDYVNMLLARRKAQRGGTKA